MKLRNSNPNTAAPARTRLNGLFSKQRMDAHDIANRIMRQDNYFIAMINRDVLDLTVPIPFLKNRLFLTRILEWNINLCIMKYVFDEQGQLRTAFVRDTHKRLLSDGLRRRFIFAGFMNMIFAPFIVIYLLLLYFFRYFEVTPLAVR
jgi:autophagy-related protein 9